jgi:GNAT superfamily N-acetyltransferase
MNILINLVEEKDLPSILALYSELEFLVDIPYPIERANTIFSKIRSYPDYHIYIATCEGKIVGSFALLIMDNLAHFGAKSGVVEDVVVAKQWQNKGIGKQMMNFAIQKCKDAGCYKLTLSSNIKREDAHKFYESLNFKKHGYSFLMELNN